MPHKHRFLILITAAILISMAVMATAAGWKGPLRQMNMDTPTATIQPVAMDSTATPVRQGTSSPMVDTPATLAPSPTMTSIFTGFTPPPTGMASGSSSTGACGSSCGMGSTTGVTGMGSMGTTITGTIGTNGLNGMGSMGSAGMTMGSCPMMGDMAMSSTGMSSSGMGSMGNGYDLLMQGMDMDESSGVVAYNASVDTANPWIILGWVVLGLVSLAIIVAIVFGVILLIRQVRQAPPA